MRRPRRNHTAAFKAKVAVAALKGDKTPSLEAELLETLELMVFRVCRRLLPSGEDVEAAVQDTMLRALKNLVGFTGQGSFGGWLAAIAVNLCRDRLRRRRLVPFLALETPDDDAPDPLHAAAALAVAALGAGAVWVGEREKR